MIRIILCPLVTALEATRLGSSIVPKFDKYPGVSVWNRPSNLAFNLNWTAAFAMASNWSAVDLDVECEDLFDKASDALGDIRPDQFYSWMNLTSVADLSAQTRTNLTSRFTRYGIDQTGISPASRLLNVTERVIQTIAPGATIGFGNSVVVIKPPPVIS